MNEPEAIARVLSLYWKDQNKMHGRKRADAALKRMVEKHLGKDAYQAAQRLTALEKVGIIIGLEIVISLILWSQETCQKTK